MLGTAPYKVANYVSSALERVIGPKDPFLKVIREAKDTIHIIYEPELDSRYISALGNAVSRGIQVNIVLGTYRESSGLDALLSREGITLDRPEILPEESFIVGDRVYGALKNYRDHVSQEVVNDLLDDYDEMWLNALEVETVLR